MAARVIVLFCFQALLLKEAVGSPLLRGLMSTPLAASAPTNVLAGSVSQIVAPGPTSDWQARAQAVPLITEIEPNIQIGTIGAGGEMPITGSIKISGMFPVFGSVGVDGMLPTQGTAYVDAQNLYKGCA